MRMRIHAQFFLEHHEKFHAEQDIAFIGFQNYVASFRFRSHGNVTQCGEILLARSIRKGNNCSTG